MKSKTLFQKYHVNTTNMEFTKTPIQEKIPVLVNGCLLRKSLNLYRGQKDYYQDLQFLLNYNHEVTTNVLKQNKITQSKDYNQVLVQCINCGNFAKVFKYCSQCQDAHYCSEGCQMKYKFTHERGLCDPLPYPVLHFPLQVELHFGTDLGYNVQVYFQHEARMTSLIRGKKLIESLAQKISKNHGSILEQYNVSIINGHLAIQTKYQDNYISGVQDRSIESIEQLQDLYSKNQLIKTVELQLYEQGAILIKYIKQIHNNNLHLIYVFNCP